MNQAIRNGVDFDRWQHFDDRAPEDRKPGPARAVEISARCARCWGPVAGSKDGDNRWIRIECRLCGLAVHGEEAEREEESMQREAEGNLPRARVGLASKYRQEAKFVLKLMPEMDRDKTAVDQRMKDRQTEKKTRGFLGRADFRPGTAGHLYAQAHAFSSWLESLPREMGVIPLSDFDFREPRIVGIQESPADEPVRVAAAIGQKKPSDRVLMARMGTIMVAGMTAAFGCEVGMKAILMTRLDKAKKTHDLLDLYKALPSDSRKRLEADFPEITGVLGENRHLFEKWRYFEESVGEEAMAALANTDRVRKLGKAARVIVDECVVAGLQYEIHVDQSYRFDTDGGHRNHSLSIDLRVTGHEAAIPWDQVLAVGQDSQNG